MKNGCKPDQDLLIDEPTVREALNRLVIRIERNHHTREDLFQEAWVHFWSREQQHPGQRITWYLQGVKFHLQHVRASGRSLDSPKHYRTRAALGANGDGSDELLDTSEWCEGSTMSEINARDIRSLLIELLEPMDQSILDALEEGWASREIAERLEISHESVRRHRIKIAAAAIKLGIVRPMPYPDHGSHPV